MKPEMLSDRKIQLLAAKHSLPFEEARWFSTQLRIFAQTENQQPDDQQYRSRMEKLREADNHQAVAVTWFVHSATEQGLEFDDALDLYLALRARDTRPEIEDAINFDRRFGRRPLEAATRRRRET
jgi:hypothetical protein